MENENNSKNNKIDFWYLGQEVNKISANITKHGIEELHEGNFKKLELVRNHLNSILEMNPKRLPFMGTYAEKVKP